MTEGHPPYFANATVMMLDPKDVVIGGRIGFLHPSKAEAFGQMMAKDGQSTPILVNKPKGKTKWQLVAGLHRLVGAEGAGISVAAIEVFGSVEELRAIEAWENIGRRDFLPIERACFVHALTEDAKARSGAADLTPQEVAAKSRWGQSVDKIDGFVSVEKEAALEADYARLKMSRAYGWRDEVAASMGLSLAAIKRDLSLYRGLVELDRALAERLSHHPIVGDNASALLKIVAIKDVATRRRVVEDLVNHPALTLDEALVRSKVKNAKADPAEGAVKHTNAITSNWARLSISEKRAYLPTFVEQLTPALRAEMRELLEVANG